MGFADLPAGLLPAGSESLGDLAPTEFSVSPGMEGPQVIVRWTPAVHPLVRLVLVRKQGEYPRHSADGVVLLDDIDTPNTREFYNDTGSDLLPEDADHGDSQWWYYRLFFQPTPIALADQLSGLAVQEGDGSAASTAPIDVQDFAAFSVLIENDSGDACDVILETSPIWWDASLWVTLDGPETVVDGADLLFSEVDQSVKYLRATFTTPAGFAEGITVSFIVPSVNPLVSTTEHAGLVLVYRSGRHMQLWWEDETLMPQMPTVYRVEDDNQLQAILNESQLADGELVALDRIQDSKGPLWRFLYLLSLEMDRHHAYMKAILDTDPQIFVSQPDRLKHLAFMTGWHFDGIEDLLDIRELALRTPGLLKRKGALSTFRDITRQLLGVFPELREGAGRILRSVDPSLF